MNFRDILLLTDLLQVSYFGLASTIFTPKCPSASVNQLFYLKYDSSNILNGINKLYFLFIKSIKLFKLNLLWIISIIICLYTKSSGNTIRFIIGDIKGIKLFIDSF